MKLNSRQKLMLTLDSFMCKNPLFDLKIVYPEVYSTNNERLVYIYLDRQYSAGGDRCYNITYFIEIYPGCSPKIESFGRDYVSGNPYTAFLNKSNPIIQNFRKGKDKNEQKLKLKELKRKYSEQEKERGLIDKKRFYLFRDKFNKEFKNLETILNS